MTVSCSCGLGRLARTILGLAMKGVKSANCTEDSCCKSIEDNHTPAVTARSGEGPGPSLLIVKWGWSHPFILTLVCRCVQILVLHAQSTVDPKEEIHTPPPSSLMYSLSSAED